MTGEETSVAFTFKNVQKNGPENYRPVRLTSVFGKIIKQVLLEPISVHMKEAEQSPSLEVFKTFLENILMSLV